MVEHATERIIAITAHSTLDRVLDQLRDLPPGPVALLLDPLSLLFSTPDHFRALDTVRVARRLAITILVADAHRTGLALAFGYTARPPRTGDRSATAPVPDVVRSSPIGTRPLHPRFSAPLSAVEPSPHAADTISEEEIYLRARRGYRWVWKSLLAACAVLIVLAIGSTALVGRVHTADVTLIPAEQVFSRMVPFAVSVAPTNDPNALQTTLFETTLVREADAAATGKATVPDGTASGAMTFRSRADGATTIKAGTALKGPKDVAYLVTADVVVPGLDFVRGQLGEATGRVRANQPGPSGNLAAGFSNRFTDNLTYISGDITGGTEKQVAVVTDDDIAGVRARLEGDIRLHALNEVNTALTGGTTALNDYLVLRPAVAVAQPVAGTQADSVHVRVSVGAQIPVYQNSDFDALIETRLSDAVRDAGGAAAGNRQVLPESIVRSNPVFVDVQGPLVRYVATVSGKTRAVISDADIARIRKSLARQNAARATQLLGAEPLVGRFTITYGPSWLPKRFRVGMPREMSQIHLRVERPA